MAAPTASFTVIPLADVDPDSPVTTDLMNALRLNDQNLFAQLVGDPVSSPPFTPAAAHDHDGVNSAAIVGANLRFIATAEVSGAAVPSITFSGLDGNTDGHYVLLGQVTPAISFDDLQVRFNGLSGSYANSDDASTLGALIQVGTVAVFVGTNECNFRADIYARNSIQGVDFHPSLSSRAVHLVGGIAAVRTSNEGGRFNAALPHANITSLEIITATGGNTLGIGSRISLYKLAEN